MIMYIKKTYLNLCLKFNSIGYEISLEYKRLIIYQANFEYTLPILNVYNVQVQQLIIKAV